MRIRSPCIGAARTPTVLIVIAALVVVALPRIPATAQDAAPVAGPVNPSSPPSSTVPANLIASPIELARLVDIAAQRLSLSVDYDAAALKPAGQVTLRIPEGLTDPELWTLVNRVLAARGFTTIRTPGKDSFSVVKLTDAAALAPVREAGHIEVYPPGYQSVLYKAQRRSGKELAEAVTKVLSKNGGSAATLGENGGVLLISDVTARVDQALALLATLDTAGEGVGLEEVRLSSLSGQQMAVLVAQVTGANSGARRDAGAAAPGGPERTASLEVIAGPDPSSVLIIAPPERTAALKRLIAELDKRQRPESVTYTSKHFAARDVAKLIEQTVRGGGGGAGSGAGGGGGGAGGDERFKVVVDELTGSLIVTGSPAQHQAVRALIDRLDEAPVSMRRPARSFVIKNRSVRDVQGILEQLLRAGVLEAAANEPSTGPTAGSAAIGASSAATGASITPMPPPPVASTIGVSGSSSAQPPRVTSAPALTRAAEQLPPVIFTADEGTNTLIAIGEPRVLDQVETLLKTLDVRQPQVMLEVLMVTLSEGQTLDLGVELEKIQISGGTLVRLSSLFGLGARTPSGDLTGPTGASGFTGVVLNPGDFSIVIRALETLNHGRSVSMPRLLVGNNQSASFDSVVQQPYASVNASNTVSTTSFGGTQDAGTVVTIKPQIAEGDHLLLEYSVSLSAFLGSASSPTLPPPRQQNRVQSVATIPDGFTVVVGGIDVGTSNRTTSQVPLLGNIPILGEAFKNRNNTDSHSRFYVFVRANILRGRGLDGFEDLKYLSEVQSTQAEIDDGWPTVEPRVIP